MRRKCLCHPLAASKVTCVRGGARAVSVRYIKTCIILACGVDPFFLSVSTFRSGGWLKPEGLRCSLTSSSVALAPRRGGRVFSAREHPIGQLSIDRLIVHPMHSSFILYPHSDSLYSCSWLRTGCLEDLARKNTVRDRVTGSGLIETSQAGYIYRTMQREL